MIHFCPDSKSWHTDRDKAVTVAELLAASDWKGTELHIVGSQEDDYTGASRLFSVTMHRDYALKFFGNARVFSALLCDPDVINVYDLDHLVEWAKERGFQTLDDIRENYPEYKRLFPAKCDTGPSHMRISVG